MTLLAILLSAVIGCLLVRAIWPGRMRLEREDWVRVPLGVIAGFGLTSITGFVQQIYGPRNQGLLFGMDFGLLATSAALWWMFGRAVGDSREVTEEPVWPPITWTAAGMLVITMIAYLLTTVPQTHGDFDAWSIWNLRARFLFYGIPLSALGVPKFDWMHPEYPYLVTASVLRAWRWAGADGTAAPMLIASLFVWTLPSMLYGTLRLTRGPAQGLLGLIAILGSAGLMANGTVQYADVPLAAFVLGAVASIILAEHLSQPRLYWVAGLCAGFCVWTKFEGLFFVVALVAPAVWRGRVMGAILVAAGAVPGAAALALFFANQTGEGKIWPGTAMNQLLPAIFFKFISFSFLGWVVSPFLIFAAYLYFVRFTLSPLFRIAAFAAGACLILGLAAMTVHDGFPADVSVLRVIIEVWPPALLALFLAGKPPEELGTPVVSRKGKRS